MYILPSQLMRIIDLGRTNQLTSAKFHTFVISGRNSGLSQNKNKTLF